ncbi:glycosyltransferase family 1 protein [Methylorubrum extorquens]
MEESRVDMGLTRADRSLPDRGSEHLVETEVTGKEITGAKVTDGTRPLLVCFSHLRWGFVWQRPQHLISRAARHFDVIFVEEPAGEVAETDYLRLEPVAPGVTVAVPVLAQAQSYAANRAQARLIRALLRGRSSAARVFWYYTPAAVSLSGDLPRDLTVYDNMDELSAFRGASPDLIAQEADLIGQADLVFTGGRSLYEAKRGTHANIHCFPSSVDAEHFRAARLSDRSDPPDQAVIPRPRLGFFGVIDERLDRDLLAAVADLRPDWHFVMIGPVVKIDPASLPQRPNIHWLGPKTYAELPDYLRHWDLGLMPFALNEATRFISPTKTPEFLAAGLRVISTPIVDVLRDYGEAGLVAVAETPEAVVLSAEALLFQPKDAWLEAVDQRLATHSWDRTWAAMQALMSEAQRRSGALAAPLLHPATTAV